MVEIQNGYESTMPAEAATEVGAEQDEKHEPGAGWFISLLFALGMVFACLTVVHLIARGLS